MTEQAGHGLTGNLVMVAGDGAMVSLTLVWSLLTPCTRVLHVRTRQQEKVHSAGRVLEDRSVLFKYMNPNLALVLAEGQDSASKTFITIQVGCYLFSVYCLFPAPLLYSPFLYSPSSILPAILRHFGT